MALTLGPLTPSQGTVYVFIECWGDGKRRLHPAYKAGTNSDAAKAKARFDIPPILPIFLVTGVLGPLHR
ncbi:hypothetical protein CRG98_010607 [Punica granatum]|uniref:Uncharacterized protein n=1 Tax=Punica granatum TaxID=22663 RepID=A0A2I0KKE1_PUNGR|nr:hypothetical protein CRG98_010607 [Punica granatum]